MQEILSKALSQEPFNTNNPQGFGGGIGTEYKFPYDLRIRVGVACFRHLKPKKFVAVYRGQMRILDVSKMNADQQARFLAAIQEPDLI